MRVDLGIPPEVKTELIQNVNIVINCAASVELDTELDRAVRINVTGAHLLLILAEECKNMEVFCHVSTAYTNADRSGYVEERMYNSDTNWMNEY